MTFSCLCAVIKSTVNLPNESILAEFNDAHKFRNVHVWKEKVVDVNYLLRDIWLWSLTLNAKP